MVLSIFEQIFLVDAAKAGAGNMEIIVSVDNRNVPNFVQAEGNARFKVSFSPQEAKPHIVSVKFNGEPVPGNESNKFRLATYCIIETVLKNDTQ